MARKSDWFVGIVVFLFLFVFVILGSLLVFSGGGDDEDGFFSGGAAVAIVEIKGAIFDSYDHVQELKKWEKRKNVKAIVLRLDSPGGGVAASQEIYEKVKEIRDNGLPVVVSMGTIAASGAYYIACASSRVFANPGTATGSIGVIVEIPNVEELLDKVGLDFETIISGGFKDTGNPAREMRPEEREYFQELVDDNYAEFVRIVAEGRNMDIDEARAVADGRVFTGRQALALGLIDTIGTYENAISYAKTIAGLDKNAQVVKTRPKKVTIWSLLTSDVSKALSQVSRNVPMPQYILRGIR